MQKKRKKKLKEQQIQSVIDTNNSVQDTNKSVRDTFKVNIGLLAVTALSAIAALSSVFVLHFNDSEKSNLKQQLQDKSKQIESLHKQLLQKDRTNQNLKADTSSLKR